MLAHLSSVILTCVAFQLVKQWFWHRAFRIANFVKHENIVGE